MYIESQEALEKFVAGARSASILAIDTEFLREKTYYPKLCLLQLATEDSEVIVDPFTVEDLSPLKELLLNRDIVKVFHSCRQDIEILIYEVGCAPLHVFDTQIAAALLGQTQQVGYASLVQAICGVKLRKSDSFTDWSMRPLHESQLDYAIEDVRYLPRLYTMMTEQLIKKGRLAWLDADFTELENMDSYIVDERERFRRLKHVGQLSRRQMAAAREVSAWREIEARRLNLPRKWILTDEQIVETCKREPRSLNTLFMVRGIKDKLSTAAARTVVELVSSALNSSPESWPELPQPGKNERNVDAEVDVLTAVARLKAKEHGIAVQTLASHSDLVKLARGHRSGFDLVRGWRLEVIGTDLIAVLNGDIEIGFEDGKFFVTKTL